MQTKFVWFLGSKYGSGFCVPHMRSKVCVTVQTNSFLVLDTEKLCGKVRFLCIYSLISHNTCDNHLFHSNIVLV